MNPRADSSWFHDDLLAWLAPGGLLLTGLALRHPGSLQALRASAPELTLPTWLAGAYALGLALSPLGRVVYAVAQAIVWPRLRRAWAPAIAFLAERSERSEGLDIPPVEKMSAAVFHDVDRWLREYLEAADPTSRAVMNRMKVLCSLSCNTAAGCILFAILEVATGKVAGWTAAQAGAGKC